MAETPEPAFELERFEWAAADRLEIVGRWEGIGGRRLGRPLLFVDAGARRRRLTALPGGQLPANGERWRAGFAWPDDPVDIEGAELEIGRRLVVDLPAPRRRPRQADDDGGLRGELAGLRERYARLEAEHAALADRHAALIALSGELRGELGEALDAQQRLSNELREAREEPDEAIRRHESLARELERERATVRRLRRELEVEQSQAADLRSDPGAATNGVAVKQEAPVPAAAGAAGRRRAAALRAARSEHDPRAPYRRAEAAREAAAHRVPEPEPSRAGMWLTRVAAVALVAGLLAALAIIVTTLA